MELGPARSDEHDALAAIVKRCNLSYRDWAPSGWQPPPNAAAELRRIADPESHLLVARAEGEPTGFAAWRESTRAPGQGDLHSLFIDPSAWGYGFGRALLRSAAAEIAASGHTAAELWVPEANLRAITLYESEGWRPSGERRRHPRLGLELQRYEIELGRPRQP